MGKIINWFTGGATSIMPWLVVFLIGVSSGTAATWAGWSLKYEAYEGSVATAKLEAVVKAHTDGVAVGKKAAQTQLFNAAQAAAIDKARQSALESVKNAKQNNPSFTDPNCAWPDSVRDYYNAVSSGSVSRR